MPTKIPDAPRFRYLAQVEWLVRRGGRHLWPIRTPEVGDTSMGPNGDGRPVPRARQGTPLAVRPATVEDARGAAQLHASGITEGFLSALGPGFLTRLYGRIVRHPGCFLLVAVAPGASPGDVGGFVAGAADVRRLYRSFVLRDGVAAALPVVLRLVRSLPRVTETLRHGTAGDAGSGRGTELLAIAVDPHQRGGGTGHALVAAFLDQVVAGGGDAAHVVVGAENAPAVHLYLRAGFVEAGRFELHPGTESLLLQWDRPASGDRP
jgi:ribosomal protein S18 acetylase RimI-like enzyme